MLISDFSDTIILKVIGENLENLGKIQGKVIGSLFFRGNQQ